MNGPPIETCGVVAVVDVVVDRDQRFPRGRALG